MELLVKSFIAAITIFIALLAIIALFIAIMHFGGLATLGLFLAFWFIAYIGLATYEEEDDEDDED